MSLANLFALLNSMGVWLLCSVFILLFALIFLGYIHSEKRVFSELEFPEISAGANLATILFVCALGLVLLSTTAFAHLIK